MGIDHFGDNEYGGKWTFRWGSLTWENTELKMGENGWSPQMNQSIVNRIKGDKDLKAGERLQAHEVFHIFYSISNW